MPARPKSPDQTAQVAPSSSPSSAPEPAAVELELDAEEPPEAPDGRPHAYPDPALLEELGKLRGRVHDLERSDERTAAQVQELWQSHAELSKSLEHEVRNMTAALDRLTSSLERTPGLVPPAEG